MPPEIISLILHHLHPFTNPSLDVLVSLRLPHGALHYSPAAVFPWLRDLEERVLENLYGAEGSWDWELLVRQLGILRKEGR